jgi:ligand-binding sensor domain-containing protein/signal transduction histidine kinase
MKPRLPIFSFVLLLLFVKNCSVFCQQIIFNKLIPSDGKNFKHVTGITQDVTGYMWLATKKGLYRYDGYVMTSYENNPLSSNSLMSNSLESVFADSNGIIWIGSLAMGLDRLDPVTGIFTHFRHDSNDPSSLSNDTVIVILRDNQGTLWIGTQGGLDRFDPKTNKFFHYRYNAKNPTSISNNQVRAIYEDRQGILWIGTGSPYPWDSGGAREGGLNRMNKKTGTFTRYLHDPSNIHSLMNNKVSAIFEDDQGVLWIGTAFNGLHKMNRQLGTFERIVYDPAHPEKLSGPPFKKGSPIYEHITFITQDAAGSYWIGTLEGGLNYYNPVTGKTIHYPGTENSSTKFNDKGAWWTFTSRDGILWISSDWARGNLYRIDPFRWNIPHYVSPGVLIASFYEESATILWIGTEEGLFRKDLATGNVKRYTHDPLNPASLGNNYIQHILKDRQGNIWLGTHGGLDLLNKDNETFTHYRHDPKNSRSLSNDGLGFIYEDPEAKLWIGTESGLNLMDRKTSTFTPYFFDQNDTLSRKNAITYILTDRQGKFWVGSWDGLHMLNPLNGKFKDYLESKSIYSICQDEQGELWVGTNDGLYRYNRTSGVFTRFVDVSSLTDITEAISIAEDNQRNLWICFTDGLIKLNPQRNETSTYSTSNGVNDLTLTYCHKGSQGKLYFSNRAGYFAFFPEQLSKNVKPPEIVITSFRLADEVVKPGKQGPLTESLLNVKKIQLHYNQNIFSFDFAVFDYRNPQNNRHLYMLENYDNTWHQAGSDRRAYYFNVPPGKYTFRAKGANSNGVWAEKQIDIIIMPPWWRTWWAYCIYGLLLAAAVFAIYRFQKQRIILAERQRTQKRELAHAKEIEKAYAELKATQAQLIQSEKMASLGELTAGIAHEIQNPLNFVNNFSDVNTELVADANQEIDKGNIEAAKFILNDIKDNSEKINHHGKRADAIVKGMLQHSRTSSGQKEPTDINALCDEYLRLSYHGLRAKDKNFNAEFKTDFDNSIGKITIVPQEIGRVLLNLYNNAFYAVTEKKKQVGDGYKPIISVRTKKIGDKVEVKVKDNGNGIPQKIADKIFQPFFTTKPTGLGTGLGLSLAYDIIKAHVGEIKVETKEGEGAAFIILL